DEVEEDLGVDGLDVPDEAEVDLLRGARLVGDGRQRALLRLDDLRVDARDADPLAAVLSQRGEDLDVDLPREDHLHDLERLLVGDPPALHELRLEAEELRELVRLRAAAVDGDDLDAAERKERQVAG